MGLTWPLVPRRHKEVSDGQAGYQRRLGRALPEGQFWVPGIFLGAFLGASRNEKLKADQKMHLYLKYHNVDMI